MDKQEISYGEVVEQITKKWGQVVDLLAEIDSLRKKFGRQILPIAVSVPGTKDRTKEIEVYVRLKDNIEEFIFCTDNCLIDSRYDCSVSVLYRAFIEWSKDVSCTIKRFSQCIKMIGGIGKIRKRDGIYLTGISLQK